MYPFFEHLYDDLIDAGLGKWQETLPQDLAAIFLTRRHGKMDEWQALLTGLPDIHTSVVDLTADQLVVGVKDDLASTDIEQTLYQQLLQLHPWRKGPYDVFGIQIETEWHSDWKWQRILPHLSSLKNRAILDVGCGNGYHMWRMLGEGARLVIGADPSQFFLVQFHTLKKYIERAKGHQPVHLLPFKSEELPPFNQTFKGRGFDTVFSMGVLYHRLSPIHHLQELKYFLRKGGELVLETLIIEGEGSEVLIPEDRYAKMRNVWFIPTTSLLIRMLARVGFTDIRVVDINQTSVEEQRQTDWMRFESLPDFLDPDNQQLTLEGYPAPLRATLIARG